MGMGPGLLLDRSCSLSPPHIFCVCDLKACHLLLPPVLPTLILFFVLGMSRLLLNQDPWPQFCSLSSAAVLKGLASILFPFTPFVEFGAGWTWKDWFTFRQRNMTGLLCGCLPPLRSKSSLISGDVFEMVILCSCLGTVTTEPSFHSWNVRIGSVVFLFSPTTLLFLSSVCQSVHPLICFSLCS